MREADVAAVLQALSGRSFARELADWVHGTVELPLEPLLTRAGVQVHHDPAQLAQCLGLRVATQDGAVRIKTVLRDSLAEQAGLAVGDDWLGIELPSDDVREGRETSSSDPAAWRLRNLDDLPWLIGTHRQLTAIVGRGARLLKLPLQVQRQTTSWRLSVGDASQLNDWLKPAR
jgi:hypothetical protein